MSYLHLVLRIIHIGAGIFWAGGTLMMSFFIAPSAGAIGEDGPKFIAHMVKNLKFTMRMFVAATLTAVAGGWLYWIDSGGFQTSWMKSGAGIGFSIGAGFGVIAYISGLLIGSTTLALVKLGEQLQGKPSPEQIAQLQALQKRQRLYSRVDSISLILSVIFMAMARFLIM